MRGKRYRKKTRPRDVVWQKLALTLALLIALFFFIDSRMRPVVTNVAAYQANIYAAQVINDAMLRELEKDQVEYDTLIQINQSNEGMVTSVQSNMTGINRLKTNMTASVIKELQQLQQQSVYIPLGTLVGNEWFSGRGPRIEIKILPTGFIQTEIYNQFTAAGINQTNHRIMLKITVDMVVILPGYTVQTQSGTNFCIAETVIVGTIPESFTQINGDDAPLISKVNDYAN